MQAPGFWWQETGALATLLRPFGALYGEIAAARMRGGGTRAGVPVLCFGDFTLGGAGKTPAAIATARVLMDANERPVFLTRGYGGRLAGPVKVESASHRADDVGDEPLLLARIAPTIVARDRVAGAALARDLGATVIVMDDGFHNPSLAKDAAVVVVDTARGIGNGLVFPAGPLRAPIAAQLDKAHALLVIGEGRGGAPLIDEATRRGLAIFTARLQADREDAAALRGRNVLAFAGIGSPDKFFGTLTAAGAIVSSRQGFADHHRFTDAEASRLLAEAERQNLILVTTEKDSVRLAGGDGPLKTLSERTRVLRVELAFNQAEEFRSFALERIRTAA